MMKRILSAVLALLLIVVPAIAEVFTGTTVARNTISVMSPAAGTIAEMSVQPGSIVRTGEIIAGLRTTKVFANQNGTIARIHAKEGKEIHGTVLEIAPVSRYTIHCTSDGAYDSVSAGLVHCGETLYLSCTKNGTHQGRGRVYTIDNETYMVEATAGEFYVGETVYLYRDQQHSKKQRVGVGTVVSCATESCESNGRITAIHVSEGEYVEKGELLYELIDGDGAEIIAPADGIVVSCDAGEGTAVADNQTVAHIAAFDDLRVSVQLEEDQIAGLSVGDSAALLYSGDAQEKTFPGKVDEISHLAQDGGYTVYISPEEPLAQLGMTVEVQIDLLS